MEEKLVWESFVTVHDKFGWSFIMHRKICPVSCFEEREEEKSTRMQKITSILSFQRFTKSRRQELGWCGTL